MSLELALDQQVQFTIVYEHSKMVAVSTNSPLIDHFLRKLKLSQSEHTWISCLRISEAVAIRFQDIECSHRSIHIANGKGSQPRTVYMDRFTFAALNKYLDEERRDLFPEVDEIFVAFKGVARGRPLTEN